MKSKSFTFTLSKLFLIFSFLLFVPEVHLPDTSVDVLTKITKFEIAELVLNGPAKIKSSQSQKIKKTSETKFFAGAVNFDQTLVFQNQIYSDISLTLQASCCKAVLARAPPLA